MKDFAALIAIISIALSSVLLAHACGPSELGKNITKGIIKLKGER
jgi:hypothetical protein